MIEHWYDYLPECCWYIIGCIALLMPQAFAVGAWGGKAGTTFPARQLIAPLKKRVEPLSACWAGIL